MLLRFIDGVVDSKYVSGILGGIWEAVGDYIVVHDFDDSSQCLPGQQMVQQIAIYDQGCERMVSVPPFRSEQME